MVVLEGANVLHRVKGGSCPGELSGVRGGECMDPICLTTLSTSVQLCRPDGRSALCCKAMV